MRNEELGIRNAARLTGTPIRSWRGGWEFLIPTSYFLIRSSTPIEGRYR